MFFYEHLSKEDKYSKLWGVVKKLLLLSHGQATVERGFSVNKEIDDTNMAERTLVARRQIVESIRSAGGVHKIEITSKLLMSAASAHHTYSQFLKTEKEKSTMHSRQLKRKAVDDEIEGLQKKKACLQRDLKSLISSAKDFALRAEEERNISLISKSNSLQKTADEKTAKIEAIDKELSLKEEQLKSMA